MIAPVPSPSEPWPFSGAVKPRPIASTFENPIVPPASANSLLQLIDWPSPSGLSAIPTTTVEACHLLNFGLSTLEVHEVGFPSMSVEEDRDKASSVDKEIEIIDVDPLNHSYDEPPRYFFRELMTCICYGCVLKSSLVIHLLHPKF